MSLNLNIPPEHVHEGKEYLDLTRLPDDNEDELSVLDMCLMKSNDRCHIFSGILTLPTGLQRVVCKIAYTSHTIDRVTREFFFYDDLRHLQGKVIPRCFGYFMDPGKASCLVLEYAGEPLEIGFKWAPEDIKWVLSDSMIAQKNFSRLTVDTDAG